MQGDLTIRLQIDKNWKPLLTLALESFSFDPQLEVVRAGKSAH